MRVLEETFPLTEDAKLAIAREAEQRVDAYNRAIRELDIEAMLEFWTDSEDLIAAGDGILVVRYEEFATFLRELISRITEVQSLETWNPRVSVLGPDVASVAMEFRWIRKDASGEMVRSHGSWLYVLKKFDGQWKAVHSAGTNLYD